MRLVACCVIIIKDKSHVTADLVIPPEEVQLVSLSFP